MKLEQAMIVKPQVDGGSFANLLLLIWLLIAVEPANCCVNG